jgi:serine/threonine protein kinase
MAFSLGLSIRKPVPPTPTKIRKNVEYTSPTSSDSTPESSIKTKTLERSRRGSALLLKELNNDTASIVLELYLVPLLSQTYDGTYIVQTFPMIGSDLTQIDRETYRTNREIIKKTLREAVDFLHSRGILHRDIKPDNVVWDGKRARLIDFDNIVRIGSLRNNFGGTIPRKNSTGFTPDYDIYCANLTIQALDFCFFTGEEVTAFWPDGVDDYAKGLCIPSVGGAASARSTRLTKRHRPKKNGRLRASQSRRRNCTRHVAR